MIKPTLQSLLASCMIVSLYACAETVPADANRASNNQVDLGGQVLTLENHNQRCALRKPDQSVLTLDMTWPCHLSVDRQDKPRVESFNNAKIIIVQHFETEPAPSQECRSQYQAVRLIAGRLEASMLAEGGRCTQGAVDQKNFVALFTW
ncbi:hypothetical protein E3Z27_27800 [Pseudomonas mediterranea]|jgi:hypothetical protein|uniref:Lipoprotein n=2 Tax=Pseudomonas mediterranea TaxID=183795 RepID=A0AAX2D6N2_9PSED|nr:hypothetical protein [Pseudomonas mediterranea]KGU87359.1 hypothetical protein N005_00365 [Pseudomonas mediterranea CFBP 5447]MBL0845578.1 hypothetical protein [Pseudomonas mediterranea]QHA85192.1 hypothetical protein E3Z27_27800 [Pseudomonas mediterranea]CAH0274694.1 hypothetical protein SRABI112_03743 [Pseudomonas mediterranea]SDU16370.1 hypothetical protein SAMN05216476_0723 [Pseudomonas mediterranea]